MRKLLLVTATLCCVASVTALGTAQAHRLSGHPKTLKGKLDQAKRQLWHDRHYNFSSNKETYHWIKRDAAYVRRLEALLRRATQPIAQSWLVNAFLCIHRGEGSWTDPNPPYYGGLQMDYSFMQAYGSWALRRWGTADHWPPSVQISVAITAYNSGRGFYPWPNTARACGLI
jgi:hypothetical protein